MSSIFKLLNVPVEERTIVFEDPTKNQPVMPVDSIYNYPSLEECPSSLLRNFLTETLKAEPDPKYDLKNTSAISAYHSIYSTLHHELVEKVKNLRLKSKQEHLIIFFE